MQTFLPYAGYAETAVALDDRRLGKQRVETLQILRALVWPTYGWKHHPAVAMWRGFVPALVLYGLVMCDEWLARGYADAVRGQLLAFSGDTAPDPDVLVAAGRVPPWLGDPAVHRSHRAALLRKDPEHYRPLFGDDEPADQPYVWPTPPFPRWPVEAADVAGLPFDEAWRALGRSAGEPLRADEEHALRRVTAGSAAEVTSDDPQRLSRLAVLAGLLTPGVTVWLFPPPAIEPVLAASPRPAVVGYGSGRQPDALTVAAMRREAAAEAEFRFHPVTRPGPTAGVGLVVLDRVPEPPCPVEVPVLRLSAVGGGDVVGDVE